MEWSERIGRRVKLRDLHILLEVARLGSMAKAARRLAVSTPVVSKAISDLERTVGARLLDRNGQGVEATMYGRALLKWSHAAFDDLRQGVKEIEFLSDPTMGEVRIGTTGAIATGFLPAVLKSLRDTHPKLAIHLRETSSESELYRDLSERNTDVVVGRIAAPVFGDDINAETLFEEPSRVVTGKSSRWFRCRQLKLADLIDEPWILPRPDSTARLIIADIFAACGFKVPHPQLVCASFGMQSILLESGQMLAMWPSSVLRFRGKSFGVAALPIKLPAMHRSVSIATLNGRMISPTTQLFIDHAREIAKSTWRRP